MGLTRSAYQVPLITSPSVVVIELVAHVTAVTLGFFSPTSFRLSTVPDGQGIQVRSNGKLTFTADPRIAMAI